MCSYLIYIVQGEWLIQYQIVEGKFQDRKTMFGAWRTLSAGALAFQTGLGIPLLSPPPMGFEISRGL